MKFAVVSRQESSYISLTEGDEHQYLRVEDLRIKSGKTTQEMFVFETKVLAKRAQSKFKNRGYKIFTLLETDEELKAYWEN